MRRGRLPDQLGELARELARPKRPNPLLALYRWRYEVAALVLVPVAVAELTRAAGPVWSLVILAGLVTTVFHWRAARRFVRGRILAVVVQHRLRTAFARARVCTLDGRLPAILWTKPDEDGIRVVVACPAGLGVDRIHGQRRLLASACFADDAIVTRHPRFTYLAVIRLRGTGQDS